MNSVEILSCGGELSHQGSPVESVLGASWADLDGDRCTDGYVWAGRYYSEAPVQNDIHRIEYQTVDLDLEK